MARVPHARPYGDTEKKKNESKVTDGCESDDSSSSATPIVRPVCATHSADVESASPPQISEGVALPNAKPAAMLARIAGPRVGCARDDARQLALVSAPARIEQIAEKQKRTLPHQMADPTSGLPWCCVGSVIIAVDLGRSLATGPRVFLSGAFGPRGPGALELNSGWLTSSKLQGLFEEVEQLLDGQEPEHWSSRLRISAFMLVSFVAISIVAACALTGSRFRSPLLVLAAALLILTIAARLFRWFGPQELLSPSEKIALFESFAARWSAEHGLPLTFSAPKGGVGLGFFELARPRQPSEASRSPAPSFAKASPAPSFAQALPAPSFAKAEALDP